MHQLYISSPRIAHYNRSLKNYSSYQEGQLHGPLAIGMGEDGDMAGVQALKAQLVPKCAETNE